MEMKDQKDTHTSVRIGMVNYINTAPIYEIWKKTIDDYRYIIVEEPPAVLNRLLASQQIDMGFVSSYEYCVRPEQYRILRDLSISSTGAVGSVFIFSRVPLEKLDSKLVLLSNQSETSACLVKIILEEFYGIRPQYISGGVFGEISRSCQAILAIGDDALRLVTSGGYDYQFDLGEIWYQHTGLPFVFSVCVVREAFCRKHGDIVEQVRRRLIACREQGKDNLDAICRRVAPVIPMEYGACYRYLQGLEYDLGENKCLSLEKYFGYLIHRGEADKEAVPLKFF
ncbi:MAG: menaquinone biosynthesis protein [Desulfopila sp.]|jgi:chorismate dehydratase|nr:menaquinone biosynthesis protein [Desulfopila sp.]